MWARRRSAWASTGQKDSGSVDQGWLDRYVDAWVLHPHAGTAAGGEALRGLLELVRPDVRYEDVPTGSVFEGHDGIEAMCKAAHRWSPDLEFRVLTRQTDGSLFALETEVEGTHGAAAGQPTETAKTFLLRGVSVGCVSDDGLVWEHRDYWDLGSYLSQIEKPARTG